MKELLIEAKVENLDTVLVFIAEELGKSDCSMKIQTQIAIAVEEIFVNIAYYAYHPDVEGNASCKGNASFRGVVIRIAVGDEIVIDFEDKGKPYNPLEKDDPDTTLTAEEREIGGLGIFMVKKIMDTVEYRHEGNKNIFTIRKLNG
jgi:anti-sigma regulatory factor (Ser/Thr protein kinase)